MAFRYCGFADEAGKKLDEQIAATQMLGWPGIEVRMTETKHFCDLDDAAFDEAWARIKTAGLCIPSFGSQIANWARPITTDFQVDVRELERNIPRMLKVGAKIIRCMSYPNAKEHPLPEAEWRKEAARRLKDLAKRAQAAGLILGHENCNGYAGQGPRQFLELVEDVANPAFRLIFDTGNQATHLHSDTATWEYYEQTREHICHVHIKAAKMHPDGQCRTCWPDEDPVQERILRDLKSRGYDGWLSIEPHLKAVIHAGQDITDAEQAKAAYVEYGQRLMKVVRKV